jgi:hypothetical protein
MTPKEITQMIESEINGDWSISNWHGCDLKKCLVRPKKRKIRFGDEIKEVWIVLEENPEMFSESKVFYDDETKEFGPAFDAEPFGFACNSHDSFIEAFKSM